MCCWEAWCKTFHTVPRVHKTETPVKISPLNYQVSNARRRPMVPRRLLSEQTTFCTHGTRAPYQALASVLPYRSRREGNSLKGLVNSKHGHNGLYSTSHTTTGIIYIKTKIERSPITAHDLVRSEDNKENLYFLSGVWARPKFNHHSTGHTNQVSGSPLSFTQQPQDGWRNFVYWFHITWQD